MPGRSCYFFADDEDLVDLFDAMKDLGDYKYVEKRSAIDKPNLVLTDPLGVLPHAKVTPENPDRKHSFLVFEKDAEVFSEQVTLASGGIRSLVDQNSNFDSLVLALGGDAGDQTLIMSDINTTGDTKKSVAMHADLKKLVASKSRKLGPKGKPTLVMPGALEKLKSGWRLASGKDWSHSTDPEFTAEDLSGSTI